MRKLSDLVTPAVTCQFFDFFVVLIRYSKSSLLDVSSLEDELRMYAASVIFSMLCPLQIENDNNLSTYIINT